MIHQERVVYWYPAILIGVVSSLLFLWIGQTPLLRAVALAVVLMGVTLSLRRLGALLAITGGLSLGLSPAYWSQTIPVPTTNTYLVLGLIVLGAVISILLFFFSKRLFLGLSVGVSVFVGLYLLFGVTERSLRLTTILAAWLIYMLIVALRQTNPRPDEPPPVTLSNRYTIGILIMLTLGVLNDPLFVLFWPAVGLGLWLTHTKLPMWYWGGLIAVLSFGAYGLYRDYVSMTWLFATAESMPVGQHIPYIVLDAWRLPVRWLHLTQYIMSQFTWFGVILGVIGIARMARWYPTLGVVLMIVYAAYAFFGLVYFGNDVDILLLPLLMIQIISMTYAIHSISVWFQHVISNDGRVAQYSVQVMYCLLPMVLLWQIVSPSA